MITAYGDDSTRRKALDGGAEALLIKPTDFVALRGEIDNRVAGAGAEPLRAGYFRSSPRNGHLGARRSKAECSIQLLMLHDEG